MSFGFGIGDFLKIVELAYKTYERCRDSTSQFKDIGRDVGNAHIILKTIGNFWKAEDQRGKSLLIDEQEQLKQYSEECENVLLRLETIAQRYGDIEDSTRSRLKFAWKDFLDDFAKIRETLRQCTTNLATFHIILTQDALLRRQQDGEDQLSKLHKDIANILEALIRNYVAFQNGEKEEPAFSQVSRGAEIDKTKVYEAANDELSQCGIAQSAVNENQPLVREWIDTVVLAGTSDDLGDNSTEIETHDHPDDHEFAIGPVSASTITNPTTTTSNVLNDLWDRLEAFDDTIPVDLDLDSPPSVRSSIKSSPEMQQAVISMLQYLRSGGESNNLWHDDLRIVFNTCDWLGQKSIPLKDAVGVAETMISEARIGLSCKTIDYIIAKFKDETMTDSSLIDFNTFKSFVYEVIHKHHELMERKRKLSCLWAAGLLIASWWKEQNISIHGWEQDTISGAWSYTLGCKDETRALPLDLSIGNAVNVLIALLHEIHTWGSSPERMLDFLVQRYPSNLAQVLRPQIEKVVKIAVQIRNTCADDFQKGPDSILTQLDREANDMAHLPIHIHPKLLSWPLKEYAALCQEVWSHILPLVRFFTDLGRTNREGEEKDILEVWEKTGLNDIARKIGKGELAHIFLKRRLDRVLERKDRMQDVYKAFSAGCNQQTKFLLTLQTYAWAAISNKGDEMITLDHNARYMIVPQQTRNKPSNDEDTNPRGRYDLTYSRVKWATRAYDIWIYWTGPHWDTADGTNTTLIFTERRRPSFRGQGKTYDLFDATTLRFEYSPGQEQGLMIKIRENSFIGRVSGAEKYWWSSGELNAARSYSKNLIRLSKELVEFGGGLRLDLLINVKDLHPTRPERLHTKRVEPLQPPTYATMPQHHIPPGWVCIKVPFLGKESSRRVCFLELETGRPTQVLWRMEQSTDTEDDLDTVHVNGYTHFVVKDMTKIKPLGFTTNYGFMKPEQRRRTLEAYGKGDLTYKDLEYWIT